MDIVLKATRDLVAQIKLAVADASNISVSELERRLEGNEDRLVIAPAARKYADHLRVLWAWLTEEDGPEYWMARAWMRRFALTTVYADDPITDEDIQDDEEYRLRPGEVIGFLLAHECEFVEGPYPTDELNEQFFEAQRGGYSHDDFGINEDIYDDYDLRDPDEGWAEYLKPEGMAWVNSMLAWLEKHPEPARSVEWVFDLGVENYKGGDLNVVALALLVRELSAFADPATLVAKTKKVPWYSHVDRSLIGNLYQFMDQFEGELDEVETDAVIDGRDVVWPWEEQRVADQWAAHFEKELEAHWTAQAKARKPILVENGQKIWAGTWTNAGDVAYNLAYLKAVATGHTKSEVVAAAEEARNGTRNPKWVPNEYLAIGATEKGLVLSDKSVLSWHSASRSVGRIKVRSGRKQGLLDAMRRVYVRANGERSYIVAVGKAIAGL